MVIQKKGIEMTAGYLAMEKSPAVAMEFSSALRL
ncbi:hypothetical protein BH10PSE19_BH10PSE19_16890 [soil metagenome]